MKNRVLLTFLLCLAPAVSAQAYSPEYDQNGRLNFLKADLNRDGYFNIVDIGLVASAWLEERCGLSNSCEGADIFPEGGDGVIDLRDFAVTAEDYGRCTDPTNPDCIHVPLTLFEPPSGTAVSLSGNHNGGFASVPEVAVTTMEGVESSEGGWSYPGGICATGRRYRALVPAGGHLGGSLVVPRPGGGENSRVVTVTATVSDSGKGLVDVDFGFYGTYGNQEAKPLVPAGYIRIAQLSSSGDPGSDSPASEQRHHEYIPFQPGASAWADFGTYGNQGATPLVPILPDGPWMSIRGERCPDGSLPEFPTSEPGGGGPESGDSWGTVDYLDMNADGFPDLIPEKGSASKLHLFSGEFTETVVDLHIASRGPDFVLGRTYRSRVGPNTVIGNGWDHSYNIYLEQYGANLILHNGSGRRDIFYPQPNGTWTSEGFFRELAQEDDESFTMTFPHKGTWTFLAFSDTNAPGKRSAITDRNGNSLTFDYDSSGRLITVHDTLDTPENSREIAIAYNTSGHIESVTDWTGRQVKYQYYSIGDPDGSVGDLKSVTTPVIEDTPTGNDFPEGKTTTYTYSKGFVDDRLNHNLLTISDAKGQTYLRNIYGTDPAELSSDHVIQQTWGDSNAVIHFTYIQEEPDPNNNYAVTRVIVNDWGNVTEHSYDNLNRLVILRQYTGRADPNSPTSIDPNVNMPMEKLRSDDPPFFETRFQYNKDFLPTRADYPNGNNVTYVYESELEPNAPPRSRGNLREIHYFAGSLEAVSDQNEITRLFVYDANINNNTNQVTCYVDARGNETKYEYDSRGNLTRSEHVRPVEPDIIYEWQHNENGQLTASIGADNGSGHRRRDEYTYYTEEDPYQNGYLKNIVVDANNLALTTAYEYDDVGNVRRVTDPRGHDTQFVVNELNQVVRSISREVTEGSRTRYEKDFYYDENDNIVQVDVQNKNEHGEPQPNTHFTTTYEYDILNYPTSVEAEVDTTKTVRTEYEYDGNHNLTLIRSGEATNGNQPENTIRYLYDERGLVFQTVRAESDPNQSSTQYDYDDNGNLKTVRQGLEATPYVSSFQYDGFNRLVEANDPMGNVSVYHYDAGGNLISKRFEGELVDMPNGEDNVRLYESSYEYDTLNRPIYAKVSHFNPNTQSPIGDGNSVTQIFYSDNSQVTQVVDDRGNETLYQYDTANRIRAAKDARGNTATYSYDENSNVISIMEVEQSDLSEPSETFVTSYEYDNLDRLTKVTDNNDNITQCAYDSRSNLTLRTDALNHQIHYTYDGLSRLITTVRDLDGDGPDGDGSDITTTQAWDDSSRLVEQMDDNGNITLYEWDPVVAPRLNEHRFGASPTGGGRVSSGGWSGLLWIVSCGGSMVWGDSLGTGMFDPFINSGVFSNLAGDTIWNNFGGTTIWGNAVGTTIWENFVGTTIWGYFGSTTVWGGASGTGWGRMVKMTYADGTAVQYVYDVHDNITQTTDAAGSVVNSTYDLLGRLTAKTIAPGPGVSTDTTFENYEYDGLSRPIFAQDNDSNLTFSYDSLSNVITETLNGQTTTSTYDGMGNKLSCTYPGGRVITCTYDELSRKKVVAADGTAVSTYSYIGPGRVRRCEYGNNTKCEYTYDNIKRITFTKHSDSAGGIIDQRSYRWDNMYNKTQRKDIRTSGPQLTHDYTYDAANRLIKTIVTDALTTVRDTDYALDGVGNRTEVTGSPDPGSYTMDSNTPEPADFQMNQYTTTPFDSRLYDKNGNLITADKGSSIQNISYDYRNRMVSHTDSGTGVRTTYAYDALGRRVEKVVDSNGTPQTIRYFYDRSRIVEEQDDIGTSQATYVYGNYVNEVLNMQRGGGDYYYHTDELYSVMAVTDDTASVVERYEYQDYGEPTFFDGSGSSITGSAIGNSSLMASRYYDPESGWYNYHGRYWDSIAGRFITRDNSDITKQKHRTSSGDIFGYGSEDILGFSSSDIFSIGIGDILSYGCSDI